MYIYIYIHKSTPKKKHHGKKQKRELFFNKLKKQLGVSICKACKAWQYCIFQQNTDMEYIRGPVIGVEYLVDAFVL